MNRREMLKNSVCGLGCCFLPLSSLKEREHSVLDQFEKIYINDPNTKEYRFCTIYCNRISVRGSVQVPLFYSPDIAQDCQYILNKNTSKVDHETNGIIVEKYLIQTSNKRYGILIFIIHKDDSGSLACSLSRTSVHSTRSSDVTKFPLLVSPLGYTLC